MSMGNSHWECKCDIALFLPKTFCDDNQAGQRWEQETQDVVCKEGKGKWKMSQQQHSTKMLGINLRNYQFWVSRSKQNWVKMELIKSLILYRENCRLPQLNKVEPIKPLICNNLLPHTVLLVPLRWSCRRVSRVNPWSGIGKTRSHKASDCLFISILNKQPTHRQDKQGPELRIFMILYMSWLSGISIKGWLAGISIKGWLAGIPIKG